MSRVYTAVSVLKFFGGFTDSDYLIGCSESNFSIDAIMSDYCVGSAVSGLPSGVDDSDFLFTFSDEVFYLCSN